MTTPEQDSKSLSRQRYSQFAQSYVDSQDHAKGTDLDRLIDIAQPRPDWVVLDVATGGGHTALKFAPLVKQLVATDITPRMLEAAQRFISDQNVANVSFKLADAEALPFAAGEFDLVTCRIAPHHFPDCARFVRSSASVLKAGGLLLVQDHVLPQDEPAARYVDDFERLRDPSHNRAFSEPEWIALFEAAGLEVSHTEQLVKEHTFLSWVERQRCPPDVIQRLNRMIQQAPAAVKAWLRPRRFGTPEATFVNHHILIAGRKRQ
jgi:ubiquinone/menaquinone biosynthesis C-methylase UbiE